MNRMGVPGAGGGPEEWFYSLGTITRTLFSTILLVTTMVSFQLLDPHLLLLDWRLVSSKFEIWRLFSNFVFFGPFSFPFVMSLFMFAQYGSRYEADPYDTGAGGNSADFAWMLVIGCGLLSVAGFTFGIPFMAPGMLYYILYVWSKKNAEQVVNMFTFRIKAFYLPWALIALNILMGNSIFVLMLGIITGHIFYFLHYIAPTTMQLDIIRTPRFVIDWFGYRPPPARPARPAQGGFGGGGGGGHGGDGGQPQAARPHAGHNWGGGRVLGRN